MILPDENEKILKYKNFRFKENIPFVIYADIECVLEEISESQTNIESYQKHIPYSVAYYLHCSFEDSPSK